MTDHCDGALLRIHVCTEHLYGVQYSASKYTNEKVHCHTAFFQSAQELCGCEPSVTAGLVISAVSQIKYGVERRDLGRGREYRVQGSSFADL